MYTSGITHPLLLGIFTKTFQRPTLDAKLKAVTAHGMSEVQFNLSCADLPSLPDDPDDLDAAICAQICDTFMRHGVNMTAISGTFNIGMGDKFDEKATKPMPAGTYGFWEAGMKHYVWTGMR